MQIRVAPMVLIAGVYVFSGAVLVASGVGRAAGDADSVTFTGSFVQVKASLGKVVLSRAGSDSGDGSVPTAVPPTSTLPPQNPVPKPDYKHFGITDEWCMQCSSQSWCTVFQHVCEASKSPQTTPPATPLPLPGPIGATPEPVPLPTPVPQLTPAPQPSPVPPGDKQFVAFVENWKTCPDLEKIKGYSKVIISFAVSYTWAPSKNQCSNSCTIGTPAVCENTARPDLVKQWKAAGTKVLLSFGGAGMGGSWAGDKNDCWEYCFGKVESIVDQLTTIVNTQDYDGVDIDYEYFHTAKSETFLKDLTTKLKASLGDKIVSHAPMDGDISVGKPYFNVLKEVASSVDYLLPQYYNGPFRPATDLGPALVHYGDLVNQLFGGDASKVLFGFCISDCSSTGSNVNSDQAVKIMKDVIAAYPECGGAYIWAAFADNGWSGPMAAALGSDGAMPPTTTPPTPHATPEPATSPPTPQPTPEPATSPPTPQQTPEPATSPPTAQPTPAPATSPPTPQPTPEPATNPPTPQPTPEPAISPPTPQPTPEPATSPPTPQPTPEPAPLPAACVDNQLPITWSGGGIYDCSSTYSDAAYCAHQAIKAACCHCGGGSGSTDATPQTTTPPAPPPAACVDNQLPIAWSGGGIYDCSSTYSDAAYCAHQAIKAACCHCGGGSR